MACFAPLFHKVWRRCNREKYSYSIHLHSISPWLALEKPVKISWRRGHKRSGNTEICKYIPGSTSPTNDTDVLEIDESIEVVATLVEQKLTTPERSRRFDEKKLIFEIKEIEENDGGTYSILGEAEVNLNDYAKETSSDILVTVQCGQENRERLGEPLLHMTIRCRPL